MEKRSLIHMNSRQFTRQTQARVLHIKYRHDFYVRVRANCCPKGKSQENVKEGHVREWKITDGRRQLMRDQRIPLGLATGSSWKSEELIKADPDVEPEAPQTLTHAVPWQTGLRGRLEMETRRALCATREVLDTFCQRSGLRASFQLRDQTWVSILGTCQLSGRRQVSGMLAKRNHSSFFLSNVKQESIIRFECYQSIHKRSQSFSSLVSLLGWLLSVQYMWSFNRMFPSAVLCHRHDLSKSQ